MQYKPCLCLVHGSCRFLPATGVTQEYLRRSCRFIARGCFIPYRMIYNGRIWLCTRGWCSRDFFLKTPIRLCREKRDFITFFSLSWFSCSYCRFLKKYPSGTGFSMIRTGYCCTCVWGCIYDKTAYAIFMTVLHAEIRDRSYERDTQTFWHCREHRTGCRYDAPYRSTARADTCWGNRRLVESLF